MNIKKSLLILTILCGLFFIAKNFVLADTANVNLQITAECNNDGVCNTDLGENSQNCPNDCPISTGGTTGGGNTYNQNSIESIYISPSFESANISWQTGKLDICSFYWGNTTEYKSEVITETSAKGNHSVNIKNLKENTDYFYKILCDDQAGSVIEKQGQFKTFNILNNVNNFIATGQDKKIILIWQNPTDSAFNKVKILRSELFFPLNVNQGVIIYEGTNNNFEDTNVENLKLYFYTVFAYYQNNNHSSGAVSYAIPFNKLQPTPTPTIPGTTVLPTTPTTSITPGIKQITINDFNFASSGRTIEFVNKNIIQTQKGESLTISVDCAKISDAKTVLVEIENGQRGTPYILKPEGENKYCSVSFLVPQDEGNYSLKINILNYKNEIIQQIIGQLQVKKIILKFDWRPIVILWIEILVMVLLIWWVIKNTRKKVYKKI